MPPPNEPTPPAFDARTLTQAPVNGTAPPTDPNPTASLIDGKSPGTLSAEPIGEFGDYELLEEVARGGMGVVYRARHTKLNRTVALKMVLRTGSGLDRFRAEAEAAADLDHPNIVPIYDVGEHNGHHFLTMKFVDGGTLAASNDPVATIADNRRVADLVATIARAVHFAHQQGIIHRDLKPANILLQKATDSSTAVPMVADFGIAKRVEADTGVTATGAVIGTPSFMPPEQARGDKRLTTAADVYSLGAVLYHLLTGRPPFKADSVYETIRQVLETEPEHPRAINPAADKDLCVIALKCLEKDPAQRYGSAEVVADELGRWLRGEPIQARPTRRIERAWRWAKRNPALAGMLSVVAVLSVVLIGSVFTFANLQKQKNNELEAQGEDLKKALAEAEANRREAQRQVLSTSVDLDLRACMGGDSRLGLLRLAKRLETIPADEVALRECAILNLLAWGQSFAPYLPDPLQDGVPINSILSPDGKLLLSNGLDNTARLGDPFAPEKPPVAVIPYTPANTINAYLFNVDWTIIATGGKESGTIDLWELPSGKHCGRLTGAMTGLGTEAVWVDNRRILLQYTSSRETARIWRIGQGNPAGVLLHHPTAIGFDGRMEDAASRDCRFLLTWCNSAGQRFGDWNRNGPTDVCLWNLDTGAMVARWTATNGEDLLVRLNPTGESVAVLNKETHRLDVWSTATGKRIAELNADGTGDYRAIAYRPDGKVLVAATGTEARFWDATSWQPARPPCRLTQPGNPDTITFAPNPEIVLVQFSGASSWVNICSPGRTQSASLTGAVLDRFTPDGRYGLSTVGNIVVDLTTGTRIPPRPGRVLPEELRAFAAPGQRMIYSTSLTNTPNMVSDLTTEKPIGPMPQRVGVYLASPQVRGRTVPGLYAFDQGAYRLIIPNQVGLQDAQLYRLWAEVLARAELAPDGLLAPLNEAEWGRRREALAARLVGRDEFEADIMRVTIANPHYWLRAEADDFTARGNLDAALPAYTRLVAADPKPASFMARANVYLQLKMWVPYSNDMLEARRLSPNSWLPSQMDNWVWGLVVKLYHSPETYRAAVRVAEVALKAEPNNQSLIHTLGAAYYRVGRYSEAIKMLDRVIGMARVDVAVREQIGPLLLSPWAARQVAVNVQDEPNYLGYLAMAHAKLGKQKEAAALLQKLRAALRDPRYGGITGYEELLLETERTVNPLPKFDGD